MLFRLWALRMNTYTYTFLVKCPVNKQVIRYELAIETPDRILVEKIMAIVDGLPEAGFHEDIADTLAAELPGRHTLRAHHHGVDIKTVRGGA